ncbi:MAG: T9SS type A sorting domain-containing protein, partial [Bacteroidota bacterium]
DDYADDFEGSNLDFISDPEGVVSSEDGNAITLNGDGTSGAFAPTAFQLHDDNGNVIVNASANDDKLYIRAKSSVADIPLRIDLEDNLGFATTNAGVQRNIPSEYTIIEYDFAGGYTDGGFGGTSCNAGPCPVDDERIALLQMYIDPGMGAFNGTIDIDWVSFGEPLMVSIQEESFIEMANLFPNPASNKIYINFASNLPGRLNVEVYDLMGQMEKQYDFGNIGTGEFNERMNIESLSAGMHILRFSIDGLTAFTAKVLKK